MSSDIPTPSAVAEAVVHIEIRPAIKGTQGRRQMKYTVWWTETVKCWVRDIEADSAEEAIQKVRNGATGDNRDGSDCEPGKMIVGSFRAETDE